MNIGTPPNDDKVLNETQSHMSYLWSEFFNQISSQITYNLGNLAYRISGTSSTKLQDIGANYTASIAYNQTDSRMEVNNEGTFEAIQTITLATTAEIQVLIQNPSNIGRLYINSETNHLQYSVDGINLRTIESV